MRALSGRGVNVVGEAVNVRDGEAYKAWLERTVAALGGCDIFVPNVSAGGGMDSEKNWVKNFEVDVLHTVRGCETLMPHLEKSGAGLDRHHRLDQCGGDLRRAAWPTTP